MKIIVANLAGFIFAIAFTGQIIKTVRLKAAEQLSPVMYFAVIASEFLWTWWGILEQPWLFVFWCGASVVAQVTILALYYHYGTGKRVKAEEVDQGS